MYIYIYMFLYMYIYIYMFLYMYIYIYTWTAEPGGAVAPPVFAKFLQNIPFLPQILAFLCLQPPHVPVSPRTFKFTPPSMNICICISIYICIYAYP